MESFLTMFEGGPLTYNEEDAKAAKPLADWLMAAVRRIEAEEAQQGSFAGVDFSACRSVPEVREQWYEVTKLADPMRVFLNAATGERRMQTHDDARPANAGLSREAGQKMRGIGWCDA